MHSSTSTAHRLDDTDGEPLEHLSLGQLLQRLAACEETLRGVTSAESGDVPRPERQAAKETGARISLELERRRQQRRDAGRSRSAAWPPPPW